MKIIDSLVHPDTKNLVEGLKVLDKEMNASGINRACLVGNPNDPHYDPEKFFTEISSWESFYPVAPIQRKDFKRQLNQLKDIGFQAIKIHPRFFGNDFDKEKLEEILTLNLEFNFKVFFCTYNYPNFEKTNSYIKTEDLFDVISKFSSTKIILLHGGVTNLLSYAEMVRANSNLLLDLSFTILKYSGSSLDLDINFLFNQFDRRICIGSDYPDFNFKQLKSKVDLLVKDLSQEKTDNITHKNLQKFLEWN